MRAVNQNSPLSSNGNSAQLTYFEDPGKFDDFQTDTVLAENTPVAWSGYPAGRASRCPRLGQIAGAFPMAAVATATRLAALDDIPPNLSEDVPYAELSELFVSRAQATTDWAEVDGRRRGTGPFS